MKARVTIVLIHEYDLEPSAYPDGLTPEQMVAVDVEQFQDPINIADFVGNDMMTVQSVKGEILPETEEAQT